LQLDAVLFEALIHLKTAERCPQLGFARLSPILRDPADVRLFVEH